jgi:hypothetical protein
MTTKHPSELVARLQTIANRCLHGIYKILYIISTDERFVLKMKCASRMYPYSIRNNL